MERLTKKKAILSKENSVKTTLQVLPETYKHFKIASTREGRHLRELLNDAMNEYLDKNHPNIRIQN